MKTFTLATALLATISLSSTSCVAEQQQIVPSAQDQIRLNRVYSVLFKDAWSYGPFDLSARGWSDESPVGTDPEAFFSQCKEGKGFFLNDKCRFIPGVWDRFSYSPTMPTDEYYLHVTLANHTLEQSIDYIRDYVGKKYQFQMADKRALVEFFKFQPEQIIVPSRHGMLFCAGEEKYRKNGAIPCLENRNGVAVPVVVSLTTVPKAGPVLEGNTVALPNQQHKPIMFLTRRVVRNTAPASQ